MKKVELEMISKRLNRLLIKLVFVEIGFIIIVAFIVALVLWELLR